MKKDDIEIIVSWIWKKAGLDKDDESWRGMMYEDAVKALSKLLSGDTAPSGTRPLQSQKKPEVPWDSLSHAAKRRAKSLQNELKTKQDSLNYFSRNSGVKPKGKKGK